jgi:hypothetical protein
MPLSDPEKRQSYMRLSRACGASELNVIIERNPNLLCCVSAARSVINVYATDAHKRNDVDPASIAISARMSMGFPR